MIRYIIENYDVDGFILDFTRHCVYFNADEPRKNELMNAFSAQMRKMVDEVRPRRARSFCWLPRFPRRLRLGIFQAVSEGRREARRAVGVSGHRRGGLDQERLLRYHHARGATSRSISRMTRGTTTRCFPRWDFRRTPHAERR